MKTLFIFTALLCLVSIHAHAQSTCGFNAPEYRTTAFDAEHDNMFYARGNTLYMKAVSSSEELEVPYASGDSSILDVAVSPRGVLVLAQDREDEGSLTARWLYILDPVSLKSGEKILVQNVPAIGGTFAQLFVGSNSKLAYIVDLDSVGQSRRKVSSILEVNLRDKSIRFRNDSPILRDVEINASKYTYDPDADIIYSYRQDVLYAYKLGEGEIKVRTFDADRLQALAVDGATDSLYAVGYQNRPQTQEKDLRAFQIDKSTLQIKKALTIRTVGLADDGMSVEQIFPTNVDNSYLVFFGAYNVGSLVRANFATDVVNEVSCP
ncbi:MAG: hypothetical protein AB7T49_04915 [Oligoflexales bacterium]